VTDHIQDMGDRVAKGAGLLREERMPWPTQNVNTIRQEFVTKAMIKGASFAGLCREYGISRKTGYKWRQRALEDGLCRLAEHSRRPKSSPKQLDEKTTCTLIRFKLRHPHWGPKKSGSCMPGSSSRCPA